MKDAGRQCELSKEWEWSGLSKNSTTNNKHSIYRRKKRTAAVVALCALIAVLLAVLGAAVWLVFLRPSSGGGGTDSSLPPSSAPSATTPATHGTLPASFIDATAASRCIVLYDASSSTLLYSKNADERRDPASLTKLLTAALACKYAQADTVFTVGSEIRLIDPESSKAFLAAGQQLNLEMILKALLLPSGNDAAYTIAVTVARLAAGNPQLSDRDALDKFNELMNAELAAIGVTGSHFNNPDGIHDADHYTTANDLLKIVQHALTYPLIQETTALPSATETFLSGQQSRTWVNTNALLQPDGDYYNPLATGLKTGHTDEAGYCLAATAEQDGRRLIVILLGAPSDSSRWVDANGLIQLGFES